MDFGNYFEGVKGRRSIFFRVFRLKSTIFDWNVEIAVIIAGGHSIPSSLSGRRPPPSRLSLGQPVQTRAAGNVALGRRSRLAAVLRQHPQENIRLWLRILAQEQRCV